MYTYLCILASIVLQPVLCACVFESLKPCDSADIYSTGHTVHLPSRCGGEAAEGVASVR